MLYPLGGEVVAAALTMEVARLLPETWSPLANDIITWGAVIVALAAIWQKVLKPAAQRLALLNQIWDKLQHEFEPNSDSSLRDAIDRTDLRLAELNDRFDGVEIYMQKLNGQLNAVDEKLRQHMDDVKDTGEGS